MNLFQVTKLALLLQWLREYLLMSPNQGSVAMNLQKILWQNSGLPSGNDSMCLWQAKYYNTQIHWRGWCMRHEKGGVDVCHGTKKGFVVKTILSFCFWQLLAGPLANYLTFLSLSCFFVKWGQ